MGARWMQAGDGEFRVRFLIFAAIFFLGFQAYGFDHVPAGVALAGWLGGRNGNPALSASRDLMQAVYAGAALLIVAAAALRTWASAYLRSSVVHAPVLHTEALVAEGPYRRTRNPLYVGAILLAVGIGLDASRVGLVFIVGGVTLFVYRLILREENDLRATQGESYGEYARRVPRLWPSLRPQLPAGGAPAAWGQAWAGEIFFWLFAGCETAYALTLNGRVLTVGTMTAVVVGAVTGMVMGRRKRRALA
jgi:protein-S-isoprenylcysteine O-methyltransferase Ste14